MRRLLVGALIGAVGVIGLTLPAAGADARAEAFRRVATFPVFLNSDPAKRSVAEIVAVSPDGRTLVYSDSELHALGFVDISDPVRPRPGGVVGLPGSPTSVAVAGAHALAVVNTSKSFVEPSGLLVVVDVARREIVASLPLGGQPDSIAVSPAARHAVIAIENERDEGLGDGKPPQLPPGFVVIVDLVGAPGEWTLRRVDLVGLAERFPEDPEPEFVDVNREGVAAVTLQENNHVVLIDLASGRVIRHWSAGSADLSGIDADGNRRIQLTDHQPGRLREPDAVAWLSPDRLATADEGDLEGGTRGFTLTDEKGVVVFSAGAALERLAVRIGHFPEKRADNKGNEPEAVEFGVYGDDRYLFVGSERASFVAVYRIEDGDRPVFVQALPTGVGPEGLLAIPSRNLLVVANEVDDQEERIRATLGLYQLGPAPADYPTLISRDRADGSPIPWAALSGLAADRVDANRAYALPDGFFDASRILVLDLATRPVEVVAEIPVRDGAGRRLNLDAEGISTRADGGFWISNESGKKPEPGTDWQLARLDAAGTIKETVKLPKELASRDRNAGLEGVASVGAGRDESVYVAFQRPWKGDPKRHARIGRYRPATGEWRFYYYPLDARAAQGAGPDRKRKGGKLGLSELVAIPGRPDEFAVIERDNRRGRAAAVKRIRRFSVAGVEPRASGPLPVLAKHEVLDLIPVFRSRGGPVLEKIEGLMVTRNGHAWIVTDNDGTDGTSGETQLIDLGEIFE